jgi:two-component system phosphate regulon sensor histidine kinase PhoR
VDKSGADKGRVDKGETSDSTGLGLAIVKRILDLHGSRINVTSEPGRGTRFEFNLPRVQQAA